MRFAAGVTLYNPTTEQLERLALLKNSFEKVFLFDNSEPSYKKPVYPFDESFEILTEGENRGLPYAFNSIIERCLDFDYLCTLDQDSTFAHEDIMRLEDYISDKGDINKVGIYAPFIDYGNNKTKNAQRTRSVKWVITSGAFVNLHAIRKSGLRYDENYFVDKTDVDMSFQMRQSGYYLVICHFSVLHQQLGVQTRKSRNSHNALRHYYMFRERFYFNNKWYRGPKKWFLNVVQTMRHLCMVVVCETEKCKKLRAFWDALSDYRKGNMGKSTIMI